MTCFSAISKSARTLFLELPTPIIAQTREAARGAPAPGSGTERRRRRAIRFERHVEALAHRFYKRAAHTLEKLVENGAHRLADSDGSG